MELSEEKVFCKEGSEEKTSFKEGSEEKTLFKEGSEEKALFKEGSEEKTLEEGMVKQEPLEPAEEITCTPCLEEPFPLVSFRKSGEGVECSVCFKKVKESSMRQHSRTHAGLRPFACEVCAARFTRRSDVWRHHRQMHRRVRPFACALCPKRFSSRHTLGAHTEGHEAGFECGSCHFRFGKKEYYDSHVRFIHPTDKPVEAPPRKAPKAKARGASEDMILRVLEESVRQSRAALAALARTSNMHTRTVSVTASVGEPATEPTHKRCRVQLVTKQPFEVLSEGGTALLVGVVGDTIGGEIQSVTIKT